MEGEIILINFKDKRINKYTLWSLSFVGAFLLGIFAGMIGDFVGVQTSKISLEEEKEKSIVDIVKENAGAIVGVESWDDSSSEGKKNINASGIIFHQKGYMITNAHVIKGADRVYVYVDKDKKIKAHILAEDEEKDIALLKIDHKDLSVANFGDSDKVEVGERAIAIGNPLGEQLSGTVTVGVISAVNRQLEIQGSTMDLIQTDAAINMGNSGGALLNSKGEIIGMTTFHIPSSKAQGVGFAIPSNILREYIDKYSP